MGMEVALSLRSIYFQVCESEFLLLMILQKLVLEKKVDHGTLCHKTGGLGQQQGWGVCEPVLQKMQLQTTTLPYSLIVLECLKLISAPLETYAKSSICDQPCERTNPVGVG